MLKTHITRWKIGKNRNVSSPNGPDNVFNSSLRRNEKTIMHSASSGANGKKDTESL